MTITATSTRAFYLAIAGVLSAALVWSVVRLQSSRSAAQLAVENLTACQELAQKTNAMRHGPKRATLHAQSAAELSRRIELAAQTAQLPAEHIVRIDPQPAHRVGDTVYKKHATVVELRLVTLKQMVMFISSVADEQAGLDATHIRLAAPRQETSGPEETWIAEVTLTQLTFSPKS